MKSKEEQIKLMKECIDDAKAIMHEKRLLESQELIIQVAVALFEARRKSN